MRIGSSMSSLRPNRRALAWVWRSAVRLLSRMAAVCGQHPTQDGALRFISLSPRQPDSESARRTRRKYVLTDQIDQHIWEISHWASLRSVSPRPPSACAWLPFLPLSDETVPPQEGSCQGGPCGTA